jgi:CubicO group peptidase (beta-lactamase class C family)
MNITLTLFGRPLRLGFAAAIVALSSASALTTLAQAADAQSAQTLAAGTPQTTSAGHTFTAASGWTLTRRGTAIIIEGPERDVRIGLVDVQARDADDAVAQGRAAVNPGFKRPLKLKTRGAARNGWEERHSYQYETSPNEKLVLDGMRRLGVPGVDFSLIDNGQVIYEGGLGVKKLGSPDPVDADTLFIAASNTKAITTLMLAQAVDDGKLRWDDPVVKAFRAEPDGAPRCIGLELRRG